MRIVFVGTSELGIPSLNALHEAGGHNLLVITKPDTVGGRGKKVIATPIKRTGLELGLDVEQPPDINDGSVCDGLSDFDPDVMVVASFWAKLSEPLLAVPRWGGINIHPSLLPRFRGAAPIQHALLAGDEVTGVTLFQIRQKMDSGEILGQVEERIRPDDDYLSLHDRLAAMAAPLLLDVLAALENGTAHPVPQDPAKVVAAPKITKEQGLIRWDSDADTIARQIRGLSLWPGTYTFLKKRKKTMRLQITSGSPLETEGRRRTGSAGEVLDYPGRIVVACGNAGLFEVHRLKREGKKEMSADEFLRGMKLEPGCILGAP